MTHKHLGFQLLGSFQCNTDNNQYGGSPKDMGIPEMAVTAMGIMATAVQEQCTYQSQPVGYPHQIFSGGFRDVCPAQIRRAA